MPENQAVLFGGLILGVLRILLFQGRAESPMERLAQGKRSGTLGWVIVSKTIYALKGRVFKIALKSHTFFAYSIDALDGQIWRKVFIRPFLNVAMSSFLQSLFEIEINSPVLVSQIKA